MFNIKLKSGLKGPNRDRGNISKSVPRKVRNRRTSWGFTLNNYKEIDGDQLVVTFMKMSTIKFAFQEEIGEEKKTPHLQGCVFFGNKIEFSTMKKIDDRISWFYVDYPRSAIKYCLKSKTRKPGGKQWTYGININDYKEPKPLLNYSELMANMCKQMKEDSFRHPIL